MSESPYATVTKVGRWSWRIVIIDGISTCGPDGGGWHVLGRERAERKARRELDRYLARRGAPESFTVGGAP